MHASQTAWNRVEKIAERVLGLRHGADVGPLLHVFCYYLFFTLLWTPGLVDGRFARVVLWILVTLLNYSLSVGILHIHGHRPMFHSRRSNRALELLLCFPGLVTFTEMLLLHVHHHHKYANGPNDITSTVGHERGFGAIWQWLSYGWRVKAFTLKEVYRTDAHPAWRKHRIRFALDWAFGLGAAVTLAVISPRSSFFNYFLPLLISHTTIGYFSWLTHAPADPSDRRNSSMNTVNNVLNLFIFNQGYHSVHHQYPGVHWSDIPSKLPIMLEVAPDYIVPYWVTPESALRIIKPERFRTPKFGLAWKGRLENKLKSGTVRLKGLPYFAWI